MVKHLDHITVVVRDVGKAKEFFGQISGEKFEKVYVTGIPVCGEQIQAVYARIFVDCLRNVTAASMLPVLRGC